MKRGELTVNTLVMMALALIVLGVLIYLSYKYIAKPGDEAGRAATCAGQGGTCKSACGENERGTFGLGCPGNNDAKEAVYCCARST